VAIQSHKRYSHQGKTRRAFRARYAICNALQNVRCGMKNKTQKGDEKMAQIGIKVPVDVIEMIVNCEAWNDDFDVTGHDGVFDGISDRRY